MRILYYLLYAIFYPLSLIPLRIHYLFSNCLFYLLYYVIKYRQKVVRKNLTSSFPEKTEEEIRHIEKDFYRWFCDYIVESLKLLSISQKQMKKRMVFKGYEAINQCVEEGQSVALYLGHYCNWEWVSSLPLWFTPKAQCGQIYHPLENKDVDRLFLRLRGRQGALSIPMAETLRKILEFKRINRPVIIGYISDQKPYWTNIHHWCDFLHHDTPVLTGAERIIRKLNHAVFYLDMRRVKQGYYEGEFKLMTREPDSFPEYGVTDAYFRMLEESIQRAPAYWLWTHNRWSRTREKFNHDFEIVNGKVVHRKQS